MTRLIAATIDVAPLQATVLVVNRRRAATGQVCRRIDRGISDVSVPHQTLGQIVGILPPLRLDLQSGKGKFQLISVSVRTAKKSPLKGGIEFSGINIGLVTATHHLIIYNSIIVEQYVGQSVGHHASDIAAEVEGAKLTGVVFIVIGVSIGFGLEEHTRHQLHGTALHVLGKEAGIRQVYRIELRASNRRVGKGAQYALADVVRIVSNIALHHVFTIVAEEHLVYRHIRANLDMCLTVRDVCELLERGAVTTYIDGTLHKNGLRLCTPKQD